MMIQAYYMLHISNLFFKFRLIEPEYHTILEVEQRWLLREKNCVVTGV